MRWDMREEEEEGEEGSRRGQWPRGRRRGHGVFRKKHLSAQLHGLGMA